MFRKTAILLFALIISTAVSQPALDSITNCLKKKPQLFAKFDTRDSFIANNRAKIFGVKIGLSFGKQVQIGIGYNKLFEPVSSLNKTIYLNENTPLNDSVVAQFNLFYFSAHFEYVFFRSKHWELSIPLQIGAGKTNYSYFYQGKKELLNDRFNFIYEPAISVEYKIIKWVGIGSDIGYRFMMSPSNRLNRQFNSPTYAFKILIYYSEIYKSIFPNSTFAKKRNTT